MNIHSSNLAEACARSQSRSRVGRPGISSSGGAREACSLLCQWCAQLGDISSAAVHQHLETEEGDLVWREFYSDGASVMTVFRGHGSRSGSTVSEMIVDRYMRPVTHVVSQLHTCSRLCFLSRRYICPRTRTPYCMEVAVMWRQHVSFFISQEGGGRQRAEEQAHQLQLLTDDEEEEEEEEQQEAVVTSASEVLQHREE